MINGLQRFAFKDDHTANTDVGRHLNDAIRPIRIERFEILLTFLQNQLLERHLIGLFQSHDDKLAVTDRCQWIDENLFALTEFWFHAGATHAQHKGFLATFDRAEQ